MACLGSRVRKKQLDYSMGPPDLVSTTWHLNKTRIRTWVHFPVVVKIDRREMRVRKGKKGAGWTPVSEDEERKFQELCLCPGGSRSWCDANEVGGLEALQARLEGAAVVIKGTTMASRNKTKFMVLDEIRKWRGGQPNVVNPARRRVLRKKASKST